LLDRVQARIAHAAPLLAGMQVEKVAAAVPHE
jgi:hypothetical protein